MAQVELIVAGDAKTFDFQINTVTGPLSLVDYESCNMYLYDSVPPTDYSSPLISWSSDNINEAVFYDRGNGIIRFFILSTQTQGLPSGQYPYRVKVIKDAEHTYTIHDGIINITN